MRHDKVFVWGPTHFFFRCDSDGDTALLFSELGFDGSLSIDLGLSIPQQNPALPFPFVMEREESNTHPGEAYSFQHAPIFLRCQCVVCGPQRTANRARLRSSSWRSAGSWGDGGGWWEGGLGAFGRHCWIDLFREVGSRLMVECLIDMKSSCGWDWNWGYTSESSGCIALGRFGRQPLVRSI